MTFTTTITTYARGYETFSCSCRFPVAVVAARYATYSVQTHDVYVMAGGAAVLRCAVRPAFVRRHVSVVAWTRDNQVVQPGSCGATSKRRCGC